MVCGRVVAKVAPNAGSALEAFQNMRNVNALTLVVDPRDLRPYAMTLINRGEVDVAGPGGSGGRTTRVDIRTSRYTYER